MSMKPIRKLPWVALVALALAFPATASASRGDRDHDKMSDRWERAHHLNTHRNDARRDPDHDGLRNLAEFKNGTDPRNADSDDDGVDDSDDVVGTVKSFTGGNLTITAADGRELTAAVTDKTEIDCEKSTGTRGDDDDHGGPGREADDGDHNRGEDDEADEDDEGEGAACTAAALVPGAKVHDAELGLTAKGAVWKEIEVIAG
jgi:hypothetical protein